MSTKTIWIVEYGCLEYRDMLTFSAAFSTEQEAFGYAVRMANEQAEALSEEDDSFYTLLVLVHDEVRVVSKRTSNATDWYQVRKVPLG